MKKIFFVLFVGLFISQLTAQNRWNFIVGGTFSSFDKDLMEVYGFEFYRSDFIANGGTASSEAVNSIKGGGFFAVEHEFLISKKVFAQTGLRYTTLGDNFAFETTDIVYTNGYGSETDGKYKWRPRLDYLAIPLNIGIRPSEQLAIYGGLSPHINIKNIVRVNRFAGPDDDLEEKWDAHKEWVKATPLVLFTNVGMSYYARDGVTFIDLRVSRSLGSVYNDSDADIKFNETGAWNVELSIGASLWKKSKKFGDNE